GLQITWEAEIRKVVLQTDSSTTLKLIETATPHHSHYTSVTEIRRWLRRDWQVQIHHVFREANVVADHLANSGHALPVGLHRVIAPDSTLAYWLYHDCIGVQTPRSIPV
ncbi:unnamed protein product, partial [Linum tenue]